MFQSSSIPSRTPPARTHSASISDARTSQCLLGAEKKWSNMIVERTKNWMETPTSF
ncbi:hypothetical protein ES288_A09G193200v1 [Gossypium darwinii]|nr:hypothetical protein ES288_A09G193200v1 [Gossypium darwinii]